MSKKKLNSLSDLGRVVYSTDPGFQFNDEQEEIVTPPPASQKLNIRLETKHRGGKTATVITGFQGKSDDLESLGKKLKTHCGTGGSAKDGEIIIQGDQQAKVKVWLQKEGYKVTGG